MSISIIGSGAIGSALATRFAAKSLAVQIANRRGPESLGQLASVLAPHVHAVSVQEALAADLVILAIPFGAIPEAVAGIADWQGRIVVDASNAIDFPAFTPTDLGGRLSSTVVADFLPGARLVKTFNTLPAARLAADPATEGGRRVLFVSGDDAGANGEVRKLVERLGFAAIDLGPLAEGGRSQQFGGALVLQNLIKLD